jgi:hypothetical protein
MTRRLVRILVILLIVVASSNIYAFNQDPFPGPGTGAGGCPLMIIYPDCYNCYLTSVSYDPYGHPICNYECRKVRCLQT